MKNPPRSVPMDPPHGDRSPATWPTEIPILPLRNVVLFPQMMIPLVVSRDRSMKLVDTVVQEGGILGLVTQRIADQEEPGPEDLYEVGCLGRVLKVLRFPDGSQRILVQGLERFRVVSWLEDDPWLVARIELRPEYNGDLVETVALARNLREQFHRYHNQSPNMPMELEISLTNIDQAGRLVDFVVSNLGVTFEEQQVALELTDVRERVTLASRYLSRELEMIDLANNIHKQVQQSMDKSQREYYLKEQLKTIRKELGELEGASEEIQEFRNRIRKAGMPKDVEKEARRELDRMAKIHPEAAEYTVSRTYLDWLCSMPWKKTTKDNQDIGEVQRVLDEDHFGLEKVKERLLEYLAVRKLKPDTKGPILCFLGPPGVGKTSLGKSIARAIGRKFERVSLGGTRDESEIRGHRRTYIGAMPGRVIKALKKAGTRNPVLMLDELDKVGNDFRGDPASALLEVLDPEQNREFTDHYMDVPVDLSQVMFIATANVIDTVPSALRDRLEVIELSGYIEEEKLRIARDYLIPKQLAEHGISPKHLTIDDSALQMIIRSYTSEAGVRNLEREIAALCRKVARKVAMDDTQLRSLTGEQLEDWLGPRRFFSDAAERMDVPGVAVGLAWTPVGGEILFIEASRMKGKRGFKITGKLGEVMKESAEAAMTYLRANAEALDIDPSIFENWDFHVHIPQGAVPKDGPSAGVTLLTALTSLSSGRLVRGDVAMTGEITLRGKVLPVGGIKEKVLAARRAGISEVILPARNAKDLVDIPKELREGMTFHFVENVGDVLRIALQEGPRVVPPPRRAVVPPTPRKRAPSRRTPPPSV